MTLLLFFSICHSIAIFLMSNVFLIHLLFSSGEVADADREDCLHCDEGCQQCKRSEYTTSFSSLLTFSLPASFTFFIDQAVEIKPSALQLQQQQLYTAATWHTQQVAHHSILQSKLL